MRIIPFTRSLLAVGFVAFVGAGCGPLAPWWDDVPKGNETGSSGAGAGGTSGTDSMCEKIDGGGDSTSCKSYDTWKQYGAYECGQKNMQLTDLVTGPSCGDAKYQNATYVCCGTTPAGSTGTGGSSGAGTGGAGGASAQACTMNKLTGPNSCRSYDLWKQDASAACTNQNLLLTAITPGPDCEGGIVGVTFTCCGDQSPPPGPTPTGSGGSSGNAMCMPSQMMGGDTSCKPYDVWKQYASDACTQQNLALARFATVASCGDGVYQTAWYTCCSRP